MKYAIAIVAAAVLGIAGLGAIALSQSGSSDFGFCGIEDGPSYPGPYPGPDVCNDWLEAHGGLRIEPE